MECPFIRETRVRSCRSAGIRKLIPELRGGGDTGGRCFNPAYADCAWCTPEARESAAPACPLLEESLVQFCAASPVTRFIPYSEPLLSRCGTGAYRYCGLYLDVMRAAREADHSGAGLAVPGDLLYTPNHWWLDAAEDGPCHLGIDAFLARLLGPVERVGFVTAHGVCRPTVVLTVRGIDFTATFPGLIDVHSSNVHLRIDPSQLAAEPYSLGWIFEGQLGSDQRFAMQGSLLHSAAARESMGEDCRRVNQFLQSHHSAGQSLAADGGIFEPGLLAALDRDQALGLFNEFCSPLARGGRTS